MKTLNSGIIKSVECVDTVNPNLLVPETMGILIPDRKKYRFNLENGEHIKAFEDEKIEYKEVTCTAANLYNILKEK